MTITEWRDKIDAWASKTFDHNEQGIAIHLLREAVEVCRAVGIPTAQLREVVGHAVGKTLTDGPKQVDEETADVVILALALAGYMDFDLELCIEAKHAVNIARTWGKPDRFGVTEHVDEAVSA